MSWTLWVEQDGMDGPRGDFPNRSENKIKNSGFISPSSGRTVYSQRRKRMEQVDGCKQGWRADVHERSCPVSPVHKSMYPIMSAFVLCMNLEIHQCSAVLLKQLG